ncbi:MAG TPA: AMP-binding protein [Solirubrobacteraceae bacterium]|nr:AMP-binding protein [Solirubrobacteraceae bacterium]
MNFVRDIVEAAPPERTALIELARDGTRRSWSYGAVADASARLAGRLAAEGVGRGDVVLVWLGNRSEWVLSMLACFRIGAVPASCPEQLRAKDLRLRLDAAAPALVIADERNREELERAAPGCPVWWIPDDALWASGAPAPAAELDAADPCLITFTSGTSGVPKPVVHVQRYLLGQRLQATHWMGMEPGDVVWCTAASGWSKSARNAFVAPWLRGATALIQDARFDPHERLEVIERERVRVLCMAPTEYRVIAKRAALPRLATLRSCVAAGEALDPGVIAAWQEAAGVQVRDGYGQTETGQLTGYAPGEAVRPGSMGRPLPGIDLRVDDGELVVDPMTVPTFFRGYGGEPPAARGEPWRTGDRADVDEQGYLWFKGRADDIIISSGYRIGPVEIEAALCTHAAVEEAAAVAAPDEERGSIVRAIVVLRAGFSASDELARELQSHVKAETAPYKYPRRIDFVPELPKTASGKIRRAELRDSR